MTKARYLLIVVAVGLLGLVTGLYYWSADDQPSIPEARVASALTTPLATLDGAPTSLDKWHGKVLVVNFWATWCAPCRKEIPEFVRMQQALGAQGLQFVGIAIDDRDKVRTFVREAGINYPILIGELNAVDLAKSLGNDLGALPFTVVFDRNGQVIQTELGATNEAKLRPVLTRLL
ncbi:MAG: redoxin family protein [Betaproteobacteria bacterium]|nr:redoxin family protein [Betaproteobacteria bacterium]